MKKRMVTIVLCTLLLLCCSYVSGRTVNNVSIKQNSVKSITVGGKSIANYRVVRSETCSYIEMMAIEKMVNKILETTGYKLSVVTDSTSAQGCEIVVGTTRRTSSDYDFKATATATNDYSIKVSNGTVYISGNQSYGTSAGVMDFISKLDSGTEFKEGYSYNGKYDGKYSLANGYKLVWADEFNGTKLSDVWRYLSDVGANDFGGYLTFIPKNTWVENGALVQRAYVDNNHNMFAGSVDTDSNKPLWYQYGYVEYRVKMPVSQGVEHAFWTSARNDHVDKYFLELDLVETGGIAWRHHHTLHKWSTGKRENMWGFNDVYSYSPGTNQKELTGYRYHTIGFEWDDNSIVFTDDGEVVDVFDCSSPDFAFIDNPMFIRLDTTFMRNLSADRLIDINTFTEDFTYIDYVRIYQKANNGAKLSNTQPE